MSIVAGFALAGKLSFPSLNQNQNALLLNKIITWAFCRSLAIFFIGGNAGFEVKN